MKKVKPIIIISALIFIAILMVPTLLVLPFKADYTTGKIKMSEQEPEQDLAKLLEEASAIEVSVYRTKKDEVETLPIEHYVAGVVASEMPAEFEEEALKAQSLSARTYIIRQLMSDKQVGLLKGADVGDSEAHQVYKSEEELKKQWGSDFEKNMNKIRKAVYDTKGQIITFDNQLISAQYFSTSNGYTENSEFYWKNPLPYLKSVESPWDTESPKFVEKKSIPISEFNKKLGVKINGSEVGEILSKTPGKRVEKVKIGNSIFTGREIREKLELRSSDFTWERKGDEIIITTKGYGHGIGMSQYGANGMAKEGKTYDEIIKHYYQGVEIADSNPIIGQFLVKK